MSHCSHPHNSFGTQTGISADVVLAAKGILFYGWFTVISHSCHCALIFVSTLWLCILCASWQLCRSKTNQMKINITKNPICINKSKTILLNSRGRTQRVRFRFSLLETSQLDSLGSHSPSRTRWFSREIHKSLM